MTTAQEIITDAFIECRLADSLVSPTTAQSTIALRFLNRIISRLSMQGVNIPFSVSENFSISGSSQSYTMGSGGTASSTRAKKITNCFIRDSSNVDHPVEIISEKDWNEIPQKSNTGTPYLMFYDPVYAVGVIYFYYKPDTSYTAYIESIKDMHSTLSLGTTVSLPADYEDALVLTLAKKLARAFGAPNEASVALEAEKAWREINAMNGSQRVPQAKIPFATYEDSRWLFT